MVSRPSTVLLALALLVVGCSGGGSGTPTPTSPQAPSPAQIELDSYTLVNTARADHGVDPPLELRERIAEVARAHSEAMRDEGYFAHRDSQGRDVAGRLSDAGIAFDVAAENLAMVTNIANPAAWAHDHLMNSSEHRPNILDTRVELIGVGVATDGTTYWLTQVFVGL